MHKRKVQYEVEVLSINKINDICCSTQIYQWVANMRLNLILFWKSIQSFAYLRTDTRKSYKDNRCISRELALHLHGNERLKDETSKFFNLFLSNSTNADLSEFQVVCMDDIPSVEDIVGIDIFIYDIDLFDGAMVGEIGRRSIRKYKKKVQLIRHNSHICYVDNTHALFKAYCCPFCVTYFQKTGNLKCH